MVLALLLCTASLARGADEAAHTPDVPLVRLALARFHTLTRAERAMLTFAQAGNVDRGQFAVWDPRTDVSPPIDRFPEFKDGPFSDMQQLNQARSQ